MTPTKWTVLFIVHAVDEETRVYSEKLFSDLLQTKSSDHVKIFVLHNTYSYPSNDDEINATLYQIKLDKKLGKKIKAKVVSQPGINKLNNLGDPDDFIKILNAVKDEIEDGKFILFTWDHGCGFGIFDPEEQDNLSLNHSRLQKNRASKTDMLMISELGNALKEVFLKGEIKRKVDILIMMNCWMQSIETALELKDSVEILIAPETTIDFLGYDYIHLIDTLTDASEEGRDYSESDMENLSEEIINDIEKKYSSNKPQVSWDDIIVCATKPENSEYIKEEIDTLVEQLLQKIEDEPGEISRILEARTQTKELTAGATGSTPWYFVDIIDTARKLYDLGLFEYSVLERLLYRLEQKRGYIIKKHVGENFKSAGDYGGISICFPYKNDNFINGIFYKNFYSLNAPARKKIAFAKSSKWPRLINEIINYIKPKLQAKSLKYTNATVNNLKSYFLNLQIQVDIDSLSNLQVNSFVVGCNQIDNNGKRISVLNIRSGAGGNKIGAGGNKIGAGGNKIGAGQLLGSSQLILTKEDIEKMTSDRKPKVPKKGEKPHITVVTPNKKKLAKKNQVKKI